MLGILFDLDGTLLDTLDDLADSVNAVLSSYGYPERSREEVRRFVGNGAARLIQCAVPQGAAWEAVLESFQCYYREHCHIRTAPYPGILQALQSLSGRYPLAIVSNKPDGAVKALCRAYFPGVPALGESPQCPRKPEPDMLELAASRIGVRKYIYVGDSEVDILTARNAGVPCLSVLWGFRQREELEQSGGTRFCAHPEELAAALEELAAEMEK